MRATLLPAVIIFATVTPAYATVQANDTIIVGGNTHGIFQLPMVGLWHYPDEEPGGREPIPNFEMRSTANWSGYTAKFSIDRDKLYLESIEGQINGEEVSDYDIIPKQFPIPARWYTGSIFISVGHFDVISEEFKYVIEFSIEKGRVVSTKYYESTKIPMTWNGLRSDGKPTEPIVRPEISKGSSGDD